MLANLANFLLLCAVVTSVLSCILCIIKTTAISFARILIIVHSISIVGSFVLLVFSFINSDFSVKTVFLNSSSIMPMFFKISASWASHEGSILLWYSLVNIVSIYFVLQKDEFEKSKILTLSIILCLLSCFIYFMSNPFVALYIKPHEGLGLNPLLQDFALSIHPPILYLGYASYIAVFVYSIMVLLYPRLGVVYSARAITYSKLGWMMVFCGVALGSSWAYRELGWGGYWFFDPVENISLISLILGVAYHHSLISAISKPALMKWSVFFGINIFPFIVLGSFLVRSGLLISVHSFASASNIEFLFFIVVVIFVSSNLLYITRYRILESGKIFPMSKEKGIFYSNIIWTISIIVILFSIIVPVILSFFGYNITVKEEYFYNYFLPLMVPLIFLAGTFAYFKYGSKSLISYYFSAALSCLISSITYYFLDLSGFLVFITLLASQFLIISTVVKLVQKTSYFSNKLSQKMSAMLLGHFGFGLLVFSMVINSALKKEIDFIGKNHQTIISSSYSITLKNIIFGEFENYYYQRGEFLIEDSNDNIIILHPENRLYKIENSLSAETAIFSDWLKDISIVLNRIDGDIIHAKIYYSPCIRLLWVSAFLIFVSGVIALIWRKKNNA